MARTSVAAFAAILLGACAGSPPRAVNAPAPGAAQKQELGGETENEFAILGCKSAKACPEAQMEASATGVAGQTGILVGFRGEPVNWAFEGVDANGGARNVGVYLLELPVGATPSSTLVSRSISVNWIPPAVGPGQSPIKMALRDMDRCILTEGRDVCLRPEPMIEFDQPSELRYEILDRTELENAIANQNDPTNCQTGEQVKTQPNPLENLFSGSTVIGGNQLTLQDDGFDWVDWLSSLSGGSQTNQNPQTGTETGTQTGSEGGC